MIDLVVPPLGANGAQEITISAWLVGIGEEVIEGDRIVELLLGEITFDVSSLTNGRLVQILVEVDERVFPGTVLGKILPE